MKTLAIAFMAVGLVTSAPWTPSARAVEIGDGPSSTPIVLRDLTVRDGAVSGLVFNNSSYVVRDVRLLVRHTWLWGKERKPGGDSPGRAEYHTINQDIPPHVSIKFDYTPNPPLPVRDDGHFETTVEVVGYSEVSTDH